MYDRIGSKIKVLAKVIFWVEAVVAVIAALVMIESTEGVSLLLGMVGVLVAWVSSWFLYGFGEIIDKLCEIEKNTRSGDRKSDAQSKIDSERVHKLEKLRSQGLITEEEYQQAIKKE